MEEMKIRIATAIRDTFLKDETNRPYVGSVERLDDLTVDGSVNLIKAVETIIELLGLDKSKTTNGYTEPSYLTGYVEGVATEKRDFITHMKRLGFHHLADHFDNNEHRKIFILTDKKPSEPQSTTIPGRPDYSPRERTLLAYNKKILETNWVTTEDIPRKVTIKGFSAIDKDVAVVEIEGEKCHKWLMACGNTSYDGSIIGSDPKIWIREV